MVDSFFKKTKKRALATDQPKPAKKSRPQQTEEDITSESEVESIESGEEDEDLQDEEETVADKRRRLAKDYLKSIQDEISANGEHDFDAQDLDNEIIASRLQQDVAQNEGKIYRKWGQSEGIKVGPVRKVRTRAKHLCCIASSWPFAYTASKDLSLEKWTLSTNESPRLTHSVSAGSSKQKSLAKLHASNPKKEAFVGHFGEILCIAVSYDNKFVVTGSRDHRIIVWSGENLAPIKVFDTLDRNGEVYSLTFRDQTHQLYAGCGDLRVRTFDLDQLAQVEILYGHQDKVVGISALRQEKCVSVGARDRTAIVWKIPEESRLSFRGGDTKLAAASGTEKDVVLEGSIDCCAMLDNQFFVTGSDNGNLSFWSTQRKKPVFICARAHGTMPALSPREASAEQNQAVVEIPPPQPRLITAVAAIPFSDIVFSGSWSGTINMWRISKEFKQLELMREINCPKGIITGLSVCEKSKNEVVVNASLSREPRLGRWMKVSGHDTVASFNVSVP